MKLKKISILILISLGIIIDQIVKFAIVKDIELSQHKVLIRGLISLTHLRNNGAAWSLLEGQQWFFTIITIIVLIVAKIGRAHV